MTDLIRSGAIAADDWQALDDADALPATGKFILGLARLRGEAGLTEARKHTLGVRLENTLDVAGLGSELANLALVSLDFPKSGDGRAFSQARLLRERHRFQGEIRATGDVLRDQLQFMLRCGFDAFCPRPDQDLALCLEAFRDLPAAYQEASDALPNVRALRRAAR